MGLTIALAAGVAYASIPDPAGVIHACRNTRTGTLRVIDKPAETCRNEEADLSWNQTGPQGPEGPPGIGSGPAGFVRSERSFGSKNVPEEFAPVLTLRDLPPGSYIANAQMNFGAARHETIRREIGCIFRLSNGEEAFGSLGRMLEDDSNPFVAVPLTAAFTLSTTADLSAVCRSTQLVSTQPSTITAIQVATLTTQLGAE